MAPPIRYFEDDKKDPDFSFQISNTILSGRNFSVHPSQLPVFAHLLTVFH
jgi:hypothetical protein